MAKKVSIYLSDEAAENLTAIQEYIEGVTGTKPSRSAALNSLLLKGAGLFLEDMAEVRRVVEKYTTPPDIAKGVGNE